ncbi:MAG: 50S ribosomal protein L29 [Candidatus Gastranaerophilales bacterium]|nr:50S ribosomal protein L29 [Candidatus Gastranaerophilales bacterium]
MKIEEIREKSVNELNEIIVDYKKQLFDIRFKKFTNKYENATDLGRANSQIKEIRRTIARVKTVIKQKETV